MRILIVTGIFPPDIGGPATYVPAIAGHLAGRGHAVTVLTLSDAPAPAEDADYPFRLVRLARHSFKPLRWMRTIAAVVTMGRAADVIFVNGLACEAVLANVLLCRPLVQKVVGDLAWERARGRGWVHDSFDTFQQRRYGPRVEMLRALRGWWTRRAATVIVPSVYLARQVRAWGVDEQRIRVVYNGVEPPAPAPAPALPLQTPLLAITVARLVAWKHIDALIGAVARIDGLGLVVVGDGPERAALEACAARAGVAGRVAFMGTRSPAETHALLRACDIFVLNSSYEGLPHVVIEAMGAGLAVVATAAGGTPELLCDGVNGRLVPARDDAALHDTLAALAASPNERRRLGAAAQRDASRFNKRQMLEASTGVVEQLGRPSTGYSKVIL